MVKGKTRKLFSLVLSIVMVLGVFPVGPFAPMEAKAAMAEDAADFYDPANFSGKRIGVQTGSTSVDMAEKVIDHPQIVYFISTPDMVAALKNDKIDAIVNDEPNLRYLANKAGGIKVEKLEGVVDYIAEIFPKTSEGKKLRDEMSAFILSIRESGEIERLEDKWFNGSEEEQFIDEYEKYPDKKGTLRIATEPAYAPLQFISNGRIVGYETEIVALFCKEYGYRPEFITCDFSGIISGITTGKFDMGASGFVITQERKDSVYFSEPIYESYYGIAFLDDEAVTGSSIAESFRKTFIVEDRWKDFLAGAFVTIEITVVSILIGTALGFAWYLLYRRRNKAVTSVSDAIMWLIDGMPTVVLLMVLFYIVFGKSKIGGTGTSIIGFSILFACFMMGAMEAGEKAVDRGQYLAAEALGYGDTKAFFRIIFPQAARHIWPAYISEISSHIKATAVVGYITVVDITKVGDLIRGRTYEAFFPLISVAVSYFIMTAVLQRIARLIEKKTDPYGRSEKDILGGTVIK